MKGPVGFKFKSFKEANDFYMDYNFHTWQQNSQTYVIPSVYKIHSEEVPHEKASNFIPFRKDIEASDRRGQLAEEQVLNAFVEYGYRCAEPMFVFHGFDFKSLDMFGKDRIKLIMDMSFIQQETDLIVVHRKLGLILVEKKRQKVYFKDVCDC